MNKPEPEKVGNKEVFKKHECSDLGMDHSFSPPIETKVRWVEQKVYFKPWKLKKKTQEIHSLSGNHVN